uniref:ELM2 domain-containing protein n=1 Tax=Heterorhabditis bacteriophora TaxID=37862 RepID=A0A1I7XTX8_HETBA
MADDDLSRSNASSADGDDAFEGEDNGEDFEATLDEEEGLEQDEDYADELRDLEDEGDLPIAELRKRYGLPPLEGNVDIIQNAISSEGDIAQASGSRGYFEDNVVDEDETEIDDKDYAPPDPWRKEVRVDAGKYQAEIPESSMSFKSCEESGGQPLWIPTTDLSEAEINRYLNDIVELRTAVGQTISERTNRSRDDEDALCALYRYRFNIREAKASFPFARVNQPYRTVREGALQWDATERGLFEQGIGRESIISRFFLFIFLIYILQLPYRRVGELVEFYYFWKKTERYQLFRKKMAQSDSDYHSFTTSLLHPYGHHNSGYPHHSGGGIVPSPTIDGPIHDVGDNVKTSVEPSAHEGEPPVVSGAPEGKIERDEWWNEETPVAQV